MLKKLTVLSCLCIMFLSSCQKDVTINATLNTSDNVTDEATSSTGVKVVDTTNKWYVDYFGSDGTYPTITDESEIIANGYAHAPAINQSFDFSNLSYDIPSQYNISADSLIFEAKVLNTPEGGGQYNYDISLNLVGENGLAYVQFVGSSASQQYTNYVVRNATRSNLPQLVHNFNHFETVRLVMKNNITAVYLGTVELYRFKYGAENSLGRLKSINIGSKGRGVCTGVALKSSFGKHKYILTEDFDTDGQSHVIYYHQ